MPAIPAQADTLKKLFASFTEYAFIVELGVADTKMIDYVTLLLTRFVHRDAIYPSAERTCQPLEELTAIMLEADQPEYRGAKRRELYRHMGDFALFWTGVYPEALRTRAARQRRDALLNYAEQGKRSYYIASTYVDTPDQAEEAPTLRRLSEHFEVCVQGLNRVRQHLDAGIAN